LPIASATDCIRLQQRGHQLALLRQRRLYLLARRDVMHGPDQTCRLAVVEFDVAYVAHPDRAPERCNLPQFQVPALAMVTRIADRLLDDGLGFLAIQPEALLQRGPVIGRPVVQAVHLGRPGHQAGIQVEHPAADTRRPTDAVEEQFVERQAGPGLVLGRDVVGNREVLDDHALLSKDRRDDAVLPVRRTVLGTIADLAAPRTTDRDALPQLRPRGNASRG
jgi:hypothetical protein